MNLTRLYEILDEKITPPDEMTKALKSELSIAGYIRIEGGRLLTVEEKNIVVAALAAQSAAPVAEWTEDDVLMFAARMRGLGIMKQQAYGQIENDLVRKLLQEFPRAKPGTSDV